MKTIMGLIHEKKAIEYFNGKVSSIIDSIIKLQSDLESLDKRLLFLEKIVKPDEVDVHNINRRIEILAQRIAQLESDQRRKGLFK